MDAAALTSSRHVAVERAPGVVVVRDRRRVAPTVLALPFLATSGLLACVAWVIVDSHVQAGTIGIPSGYLPMVAGLVAVAVLFAVPAWRLTHVRRVSIAVHDGFVDETDSNLGIPRTRRHALSGFTTVKARRLLRTSSRASLGRTPSRGHEMLVVDLCPAAAGSAAVRLAFEYDPAAVRAVAALVAQATGRPMIDELAVQVVELAN